MAGALRQLAAVPSLRPCLGAAGRVQALAEYSSWARPSRRGGLLRWRRMAGRSRAMRFIPSPGAAGLSVGALASCAFDRVGAQDRRAVRQVPRGN
eukprot:4973637-Pyramimonas_sp.AAC.1